MLLIIIINENVPVFKEDYANWELLSKGVRNMYISDGIQNYKCVLSRETIRFS